MTCLSRSAGSCTLSRSTISGICCLHPGPDRAVVEQPKECKVTNDEDCPFLRLRIILAYLSHGKTRELFRVCSRSVEAALSKPLRKCTAGDSGSHRIPCGAPSFQSSVCAPLDASTGIPSAIHPNIRLHGRSPHEGNLNCDSPADLALSSLSTMPQFFNTSSIAFSIFTGDIVSHDNDDQVSLALFLL